MTPRCVPPAPLRAMPFLTGFFQFQQEEIAVPYIQGELHEQRTYKIRYCPAMDAVLRTIEDPDLQGFLTMYPQRHYVCNPRSGPNMRVWTDLHTAEDWWSLQVYSLLNPSSFALTIIAGQNWTRQGRNPHAVVLRCDATEQGGDEEVVGCVDVHRKHPPGASHWSEEEGGRCPPWSNP